MIRLELTQHEGTVLMLLLILGHDSYFLNESEAGTSARGHLDRIPTDHLDSLIEKVDTAVAEILAAEGTV